MQKIPRWGGEIEVHYGAQCGGRRERKGEDDSKFIQRRGPKY